MYCEDTSTSSEDEASAAASTTSTTTTADMCRVEVRNGEKVLRCTECGYASDRRANVTRHYRRIHAELKQEKYRECPCGQTFHTKWEFYNHCDDHHPNLRQSWYTTTHVYKLKQTKARQKLKSADRPYARPDTSSTGPAGGRVATRASSRRLRSQDEPSTSSAESSITSFDSGNGTCSTELSRCSFSSATDTASEKGRPFRTSESSTVSFSSGSDTSVKQDESFCTSESEDTNDESATTSEDINDENATTSFAVFRSSEGKDTNGENASKSFPVFRSSESEDTNEENVAASFAHLPIKKRYLQVARRVFGDITNKMNVEVQKVNDYSSNSISQVPARDLYLSNIREEQREYLSLIDFDELDAILKLRDMKKSM